MYAWFRDQTDLTEVEGLENINTYYLVTEENKTSRSMSELFRGCTSLKEIDLSKLDMSHAKDIGQMFWNCTSLENVHLDGINTSGVEKMDDMFYGCTSLRSIDITDFDTGNTKNMYGMFEQCTALESVKFEGLDTSNVTDFHGLFRGCTSLKSMAVGSLDTTSATDVGGMFYGCSGLEEVDLTGFDINNGTKVGHMFTNCSSLKTIYANCDADWGATMDNNNTDIFAVAAIEGGDSPGLYSITGGNGTQWQWDKQGIEYACVDGLNGKPGYFTAKHTLEYTATPATPAKDGAEVGACRYCDYITSSKIAKPSGIALSYGAVTYSGTAKKPAVTVKDSAKNKLSADDYTVTYSNNVSVGTAKVKVTFQGDYSGEMTATFKINPKGTSLSKLVPAKKALTVKWKKQTAKMKSQTITGYQIQLATNSKFTSGKKLVTVKGYTSASKTVKRLKAKKRYYVRIRTYKTISGKTYYSGWSKVKYAKTK